MTVTKSPCLLYVFESKIEEAVSLVPNMCATEKLKAVQLWNTFSEKLQIIVNNSVIDIPSVAVKTGEESEKVPQEMNSSGNTIVSECSDFFSLQSDFGICTDSTDHYQTTHMSDPSVKEMLPSDSYRCVSSLNSEEHLDSLNSTMCSQENTMPSHYTMENITSNNCDSLNVKTCCVTVISSNIFSMPCLKNNCAKDVVENVYADETVDVNLHCTDDSHKDKSLKQNKIEKFSVRHLVPEKDSIEICVEPDILSKTDENSKEFFHDPKMENKQIEGVDSSAESTCDSSEKIVNIVESNSEETFSKDEVSSKEICSADKVTTEANCDKTSSDDNCVWLHSKQYACSDCKAQFSNRGNLNVHMRRHTGEKPYPCNRCPSRFSTKGNLQRHLKTHTGEKPFECSGCGSRFTEKKSLMIHMRRHTGEKPYKCEKCGKCFSQSVILQNHMAMHLNQKIHLCEQCGKSFRQKSQLHIHKLRHENIRKYSCPSCSSRFLIKGDLDRHMRMHTGERPFICRECPKSFTRQQSLKEHMNRHYGIRPYACKYCGKTFYEMSACYKHAKCHEKSVRERIKIKESDEYEELLKDQHNVEECPDENLCASLKAEANKNFTADENNQALTSSFVNNFF